MYYIELRGRETLVRERERERGRWREREGEGEREGERERESFIQSLILHSHHVFSPL